MKTGENETRRDPFLCTCGPCKRFWKSTFGPEAGRLKRSPICKTKLLNHPEKTPYLPLGGRVTVNDKHTGTVRYVGYLERHRPKLYVGVKLDDNVNSTHNGILNGKRYFYCPKGHGAMVEYDKVRPMSAPNKKPAIRGNYMFPSYEVIRRRRQERSEQLSALETSSNNSSPRSTPKVLPALERSRSASTVRPTNDPKDMAYQDRLRELEREKRKQEERQREQRRPRKREPTPIQKWTKEFGGDERAARMAETLERLRLAYEEGLKLVQEEEQYDHK
ncbi:tubulin-specific chaperone E-like isoform X1 [Liolophura sinensis]|uniref:tubulin-specific chaperone E-like isoform X1 n=1 Tax=Liolophura sinensis TaxID=3198878 RepID=UPI003158BE01